MAAAPGAGEVPMEVTPSGEGCADCSVAALLLYQDETCPGAGPCNSSTQGCAPFCPLTRTPLSLIETPFLSQPCLVSKPKGLLTPFLSQPCRFSNPLPPSFSWPALLATSYPQPGLPPDPAPAQGSAFPRLVAHSLGSSSPSSSLPGALTLRNIMLNG